MKVQEFSRCGTPNKRSPGFPFVGCRLPVLKRYPAVQGGGAGYESHRLYNRLEYEQPHTVVWFALVREFTGVYGSLWEFTGVYGSLREFTAWEAAQGPELEPAGGR